MQVFRSPADRTGFKRLAALVALVAVFFLPLHFHSLTAPAKVAKECACVQGTRTVMGLAPAPPSVIPVFAFQPIAFAADVKYERLAVSFASIRAPPMRFVS
jgi:hypothetical protein